ncbi:histidine phosphatase family protein [Microbacterium sp. BK668]|uniref:SixA phosphatase family protein n=1 Tax=Microbacterium sp. BK668 TaxID=2512118 RepID=UPI00105F9F7D|nr:histidine phosphatase family protein [Microbacterium sp. BK668]TDN92274.1 phosphohistidine phosphatase [Microbacterium sp. BK668]
MTRLVLVRHAKSDWGDASLDDHDRPLNDRGLRDAPRMAARLAGTGFRADAILSSTALRASTTAGFFGQALGVPVERQERLYGAPASLLLRAGAERGVGSVVVVAHDPGMTVLAGQLSDGGIGHMPTCAVATFVWDEDDWEVATAVDPESWTLDTPR